MLVDVYNKDGQKTGEIELKDDIFAVEPNEHAMHQSVVSHLAAKRQGTHKTKVRAEVRGGGKKPWRQKGRGTARAGSTRSPLWVGGGTIHGPQTHKYNVGLPKKVKRLARKSALSMRLNESNLIVLDDFTLEEFKTKEMYQLMKNLNIEEHKTLMLLPERNEKIYYSSKNIKKLNVNTADSFSTYDVLSNRKLIIFKGAVETIENAFNN